MKAQDCIQMLREIKDVAFASTFFCAAAKPLEASTPFVSSELQLLRVSWSIEVLSTVSFSSSVRILKELLHCSIAV